MPTPSSLATRAIDSAPIPSRRRRPRSRRRRSRSSVRPRLRPARAPCRAAPRRARCSAGSAGLVGRSAPRSIGHSRSSVLDSSTRTAYDLRHSAYDVRSITQQTEDRHDRRIRNRGRGLTKSYGADARPRRPRPARRAGRGVRAARTERRRQDDDRADPGDADSRRTAGARASPATTSSPSAARSAARSA